MIWGTAAMPIDLKGYANDVEEQINPIHEDLAPLEAGTMTIGEREGQTYELILADLQAIARGE
jgi:hypothetical protein